MKLAKKVLAAVMAIAMIAGLSAMAFAAAPTVNFVFGDVTNGKVKVSIYFDDAVGLKSWDVTINYDADVLTYERSSKGADASAVGNVGDDNSFTDEKNTGEAGKILYSGYFKDVLWDAAKFAEYVDENDAPVVVNSNHFHAATLTFVVKDTDKAETAITAAVTNFGGVDNLAAGSATLKLKEPVTDPTTKDNGTTAPEKTTKKDDDPSTTKAGEKTTDDANHPTKKGHDGKGNVNTGDNMALVAAGAVVILAGAAFVISKKKK